MNGEVGIDIYTLLCIKYVTDKSILYSTGNSVLYSDLNGKEIHKRGAICMHMGFLIAQLIKNPPAIQEIPV